MTEAPKKESGKVEKPSAFQLNLERYVPEIAKSVFGEVLRKAQEAKEEKKKEQDNLIDQTARNLASVTTGIEVGGEGENSGKVKIKLDMAKIPVVDGKRLTAGDIFTPDVKSFSVKFDQGEAIIAERKNENGDIDYYYTDAASGKQVRLTLPDEGQAQVTISKDDLLDKTRDEILAIMKKEITKAARRKRTASQHTVTTSLASARAPADAPADVPAEVPPERVVPSARPASHAASVPLAPPEPQPVLPAEVSPETQPEPPAKVETFKSRDVQEYVERMDALKQKLDPSDVSIIPETQRVQEIPLKKKGVRRLALFSDTDDKSHETTRQQNLEAFQKKLPEWDVDCAMGIGDYISETAAGSGEKYRQVAKQVREEFKKFTTPYALAIGNHDRNRHVETDTMQDLFKGGLENYEEVKGAYSFTIGNATFVVFNEGTSTITDTQVAFFERKSKGAKGAVYMVNHIPPYQFAYGAGLSEKGGQKTENFDKIKEIAKKNVEKNGNPFYIISGDNHLPAVIGNFLSPGGMGAKYYGLNGKRLQTVYSAAVVDIDEKTGRILAVYLRSAESGFKDPLPELQESMAWNNRPLLAQYSQENMVAAK